MVNVIGFNLSKKQTFKFYLDLFHFLYIYTVCSKGLLLFQWTCTSIVQLKRRKKQNKKQNRERYTSKFLREPRQGQHSSCATQLHLTQRNNSTRAKGAKSLSSYWLLLATFMHLLSFFFCWIKMTLLQPNRLHNKLQNLTTRATEPYKKDSKNDIRHEPRTL